MGLIEYIKKSFFREVAPKAKPQAPHTETTRTPRRGGGLMAFPTSSAPLSVSTVFRCVQLLGDSVACTPMQVMKRRGGVYVDDRSAQLHYLLNVQPNPSLSAFDFWRAVVQEILLAGNAYVVPIYDVLSHEPSRLVLCSRHSVTQTPHSDTYQVSDTENGLHGTYKGEDILHFKGQVLGGASANVGVSVLTYARLTIDTAAIGDSETRSRFSNGGNVRGLVSNGNSVRGFGEYQDEQLKGTAENLDQRFQDGERILSLPGDVNFKQISLSSTDMQFLESRKFTVREICRFFGVHPSFVFDDTSTNYKSSENATAAFLTSTLNPLLRKIECELVRKLISPKLYGRVTFEFDRRSLYDMDLLGKIEYQRRTIEAGLYTVNEWRKEENCPPVEGGDTALISANLRALQEAANDTSPTS